MERIYCNRVPFYGVLFFSAIRSFITLKLLHFLHISNINDDIVYQCIVYYYYMCERHAHTMYIADNVPQIT